MSLGPSLLSCDSIFLSLSLLVCGMGIARLTSQGSCEQQKSMVCSEEQEGGIGSSVICFA